MSKPFEWYYFDLHSAQGYDLVFTLHSRPFMTLFNVAIFDIFLYKNNQLQQHIFFSRPLKALKQDKKPYEVYFDATNFILYKRDEIEVRASYGQTTLHLQFSGLLEPHKRLKQNLLPGNRTNEFFGWELRAPLCLGRANMRIATEQLRLTGQAYHDYNAGNISLKKKLLGWRWGKYYFEDALLIIGEIAARGGPVKKVSVLAQGKALKQSDEFELIRSADGITLNSDLKSFEISKTDQRQLDDIRFLSIEPPKILLFPAKIVELIFAFCLRFNRLTPFTKMLANVRYVRQRLLGQNKNEQHISIFQEEIFF